MSQRTTTIAAALLRHDDQIMLVQQQGPADPAATWALPGGVVEDGELLTEALVREVQEETGLFVSQVGCLAYATQLDDVIGETQSLAFVFEVSAWFGTIRTNDPDNVIRQAKFCTLSEARARIGMLPWRTMREPLLAALHGTAPHGSVWLYRRAGGEDEELIARIG